VVITKEDIGVSHPNQIALPVAVGRWIDQSQALPDAVAVERLSDKFIFITEAIDVLASDTDDAPVEIRGLSVIDLMSAQATLTIEIGTRRRHAEIGDRMLERAA
jgi:hypothetical protein